MPFDSLNRTRRRTGPTRLRSKLEERVDYEFDQLGIEHSYETETVGYIVRHTYTPDFTVPGAHPFHVEVKGWLSPEDRAKLLAVVVNNPRLPLLVALQSPNQKISKKSKTTVSDWATKHGICWTPIPIPKELIMQWLDGKRCTFPALSATAAMRPQSAKAAGCTASAVGTKNPLTKGDT